MITSVIIGTGSYIPDQIVANKVFENNQFYDPDGTKVYKRNQSVIAKFSEITGILERRYAGEGQNCSDLAVLSAERAIASSAIDPETLDYIIVAHNFGDVSIHTNRTSQVPSIASRVKAALKINNPDCVAYDILFGCPGWIEGVIHANSFIRSGMAKRCLIVGAETLSRVIDPHDRDSMIYADGSGAVIIEASNATDKGIVSWKTRTFSSDSNLLRMGPSYSNFSQDPTDLFLKMTGRKVYELALKHVPVLMKNVIESAGLHLSDIKKVLLHQANDKMDQAILQRLFSLYGLESISDQLMPMTISWLGNSSVATVPTLLDLVCRKKIVGHEINAGDNILLASVGAGMNVNALLYRF